MIPTICSNLQEIHPCKPQAYYTDQPVSALHLGITGSLIYGCNSHLIGRIKNNPAKVLLGAVQLITAIGLTISLFMPITSAIPGLCVINMHLTFIPTVVKTMSLWLALICVHTTAF